MALTQISTDGIKNGTITGSDLATNVNLVDNQKIRFGTGNDLQIFHDGSASSIDNATGQLAIACDDAINLQSKTGAEYYFRGFLNNRVELYYDGSKKLETTSGGVLATGDVESSTGIFEHTTNFTTQLKFNSSNETQLKHLSNGQVKLSFVGLSNAARGAIDAQSGFIRILTAADETGIICRDNSSTDLHFDGSKKLETTTTGVTVTGQIISDGLRMGDSELLKFGSHDDLQIYHDGSNSFIKDSGTGGLFIQGSGGGAGITLEDPDGNDFIKCIDEGTGGTVELYKAGTKRLHTTTSGVTVTGKITTTGGSSGSTVFNEDGADVDFRVEGDTQASLFKVDAGNDRVGIGESDPSTVFQVTQFNHAFADSTSSLATVPTKSVARFRGSNNASGSLFIGNESSNARCYLQGCNDTGNGSIDLLLNPFGANVGIGTTSPVTKLHINGGTYAAPTGGNDGFTQLVVSNQAAGQGAGIGLLGAGNMVTFIHFGDSDDANVGAIVYNNVVDSMQFYVNAAERMNIDSSGNLNLNNDSGKLRLGTHADLQIFHDGGDSHIEIPSGKTGNLSINMLNGSAGTFIRTNSSTMRNLTLRKNTSGADNVDYFQCRNSADTLKLQIQGTGDVKNTNQSYGQISDIKLKENVVDANSQWNDIKAIRVRNWNYKESTGLPTHKQIGVVAQELETVSAGLVDEQIDRDDTGADLGTTTKGVKYSVLYMKAIKCLQEAMAKIEVLETEVAALKAA